MEWLSHSQKKHCELCKTPFRFTKLYAPNMPRALPFHIFLSHLVRYLFRNIVDWCRWLLVISVWLGLLPWLMRWVWSSLFWLSDEGLGGGASSGHAQNAFRNNTISHSISDLTSMGICPASPLFAATTSPATMGNVIERISPQLVKSLSAISLTGGNYPFASLVRLLLGSGRMVDRGAASTVTVVDAGIPDTQQTLLSHFGFLRNLTRSPWVNRQIISILEGQLITVAVVVTFILIILVRDYVVQQQPDGNMRADFADGNEPAPQPPVNIFRDIDVMAIENLPGPDSEEEEEDDDDYPASSPYDFDHGETDSDEDSWTGPGEPDWAWLLRKEPTLRKTLVAAHQALQDPGGPDKSPRDIEDDVRELLRIYKSNDRSVLNTINAISEKQLDERLIYWVQGLEWIRDNPDKWPPLHELGLPSTDNWPEGNEDEHSDGHANKGKGRADNSDNVDGDPSLLIGNPLRPRANTDGPKINNGINPLANNSWSFANLPPPPAEPSSHDDDQSLPELEPLDSPGNSPFTAESIYATPDRRGSDWLEVPELELPEEDDEGSEEEEVLVIDAVALPPQPEPVGAGLVDRVANFMWQDVEAIDLAEPPEPALDDAAEDELGPFAVAEDNQVVAEGNPGLRLNQIAADLDAQDIEAIEDAEDLDGILELIGIRGPIAGLIQNAIFCAFLVSVTIFAGVFLPYNIGRITLWTVANPMRPVRMLLALCLIIQDLVVVCLGSLVGGLWYVLGGWWKLLSDASLSPVMDRISGVSWNMTKDATVRMARGFNGDLPMISVDEMRHFSAVSHAGLITVKSSISSTFCSLGRVVMLAFAGSDALKASASEAFAILRDWGTVALSSLKALPQLLADPNSWVIELDLSEKVRHLEPEGVVWSYGDRAWAVLTGYATLSTMAGLYLQRGHPFSTNLGWQDVEVSIMELLKQASGVMKVILIIGIEMLVFPFYCGLLLDIALLPLFEDATVRSRILFTVNSPYTSCFVHWFVGTGYMFHFALFVSMCRKIMRKGVLYFIRDPDDPEFHPVRDVLERSVTTQLRKILFSAFVYGALVIVCLGGVVWGLAYSLPDVLPIHYSSNEPVLEFPIDLLFYNFLMPMAVNFFKPSDGLHAMYTWWFRKCARMLRITWFLFGERKVDEEGTLALPPSAPNLPWWKTIFLELDEENGVQPKTWKDIFEGGTAKPTANIPMDDMIVMNVRKRNLVATNQSLPDGRFVRAPASDQVKIPKGKTVFLQVTEQNTRMDGKPDRPETDIYSTNQYQLVYVPPHFRLRIFLFIAFIWAFAAVTGVGLTIIPLVFGRHMFKLLIPAHIRTNDIYAFSIGIYVLGSLTYGVLHARSVIIETKALLTGAIQSVANRAAVRRAGSMASKVARLLYAYFFLLVAFPFMVVSLFELYLLIPLHTYMHGAVFANTPVPLNVDAGSTFVALSIADINPKHTIRVIQAWTIGLLYMKLASRAITHFYRNTRLAAAVRAVFHHGYLNPNVTILTRAFIVPGTAIFLSLIIIPLIVGRTLIAQGVAEQVTVAMAELIGSHQSYLQALDPSLANAVKLGSPKDLDQELADAVTVLIYRMSFPITQALLCVLAAVWGLWNVFRGWKVRIRDEAYLIGERLHNFGQSPQRGERHGGSNRGVLSA
jgi:E3 ubiquitin-protein ligase MARCH6